MTFEFEDYQDEPVAVLEEDHDQSSTDIIAAYMLDYLNRSCLEVVIHQNEPIRITVNNNTQWYQDFCAAYQASYYIYRNGKKTKHRKRFRTIIKRCDTIAALKRIIAGNTKGIYAERLQEYIDVFWPQYSEGY